MGMTRVALREFKVLKKKSGRISFSLSLLWKCKKEGLNDSRVFSKKRWIPWIFYYSVCRGVSQFVFRRTNKKLANFFPLEARLTSRYVFFDQLKYFRQLKKIFFSFIISLLRFVRCPIRWEHLVFVFLVKSYWIRLDFEFLIVKNLFYFTLFLHGYEYFRIIKKKKSITLFVYFSLETKK